MINCSTGKRRRRRRSHYYGWFTETSLKTDTSEALHDYSDVISTYKYRILSGDQIENTEMDIACSTY
jgi:hypothetical protein